MDKCRTVCVFTAKLIRNSDQQKMNVCMKVLQDSRTLYIRVLMVFPALPRLDWEFPAILALANIEAWWRLGELPKERF